MSRSLKKLDKKRTPLNSQMDAARERGDEKAMETISRFLNKSTRKREEAIEYSMIARANPRENQKVKKKIKTDETIEDEKEEDEEKKKEEALGDPRVAIYDELVARKDPAEPN